MLQQEKPDDFVISSSSTEPTKVRTFVEMAFEHVGIKIKWEGEEGSVEEVGKDADGVVRVKVNPKYFRPTEVDYLHGDCSKAKKELKWIHEYDLVALVKDMMDHDLA